jgi:PAS domain S-box-containing protein
MSTVRQGSWAPLFGRAVGAIVFLVSVSVLAGWAFNFPEIISVLPAWPKMAALTALAFALAAVSLWLQARVPTNDATDNSRRQVFRACAALVTLIGLLGLTAAVFGWNLRLDDFSIEKLPAARAVAPAGGMSAAVALAFVLLGSALLLARSSRSTRLYQACAMVVLLIGWVGFSRYVFGGEPLVPYATMAIHTTTMFMILGAGVLSLRTDVGLVALLASDRVAGLSVRRLLPAAILIPLIAGSLALHAERVGWVGTGAALSLFGLVIVILFAGLVWISAATLERADRQHRTTQQLIVETALDAVITIDKAGLITGWSAQAESLFGWPRGEAIGRLLADTIIPERYREAHRRGLQRYLDIGEARVLNQRIELSALHRENGEFPVEIAITPIGSGNDLAFSAFVRDITERRRATEALRESQQLLQAIIDNSMPVIYVKDLAGRYMLVNRRFEDIFQLSRDAIVGRTDHEIFPKEAADAFRSMDKRVAAANHAITEEETAPHHDGLHDYLSVKAPLRDAAGMTYAVFGISTDITERKRTEERLRSQLERLNLLDETTRAIAERQDLGSIFRVVVRSLEDRLLIDLGCVCLYDSALPALSVMCVGGKSQSLAAQLAITEHTRIDIDENDLARCVRGELVHEADIGESPSPFAARLARAGLRSLVLAPLVVEGRVFGVMIAARREPHSFTSSDCEFLRQLSQHVSLAAHQAQLYTALQRAYEDLRQTQQTVMQQERLRALGQMASGIAHDINNALSPAALYVQSLLERDSTLSVQAKDYLVIVQRAIEDVAETVARMREFYRPRESELALAPVDLNRILQQVLDLTRARWSDMPQERGIVIRMHTAFDANLPTIMGAESEIRDALTNLVLNAVDAMPQGGTITLRSVAGARTDLGLHAGASPTHVSVEVSDTGIGMSAAVRSRCLEPFYTTKGERGTGLGLAMVYGMAQRHNADLQIDSEPGAGTTMRLIFPIVTGRRDLQPTSAVQPLQPLRILLVDDDPLLLESLQIALINDGHTVVIAEGGQAGIDAFAAAHRQGERFSVVITDLGMPNVDGRTVAASIKSIAPATPVILLTGWGHRLQAENDLPEHVDRVLSKPPKVAALRAALAEVTAADA